MSDSMGQKAFANQHRHVQWLDLKAAACLVRYSSRLDGAKWSASFGEATEKVIHSLQRSVVRLRVIVSLSRDLFSQLALAYSELRTREKASAFTLICNKNNTFGPYDRIWINFMVVLHLEANLTLQRVVSVEYELSLLPQYVAEDRQVKMDILLHCLSQKSKQTRPGPSPAIAKQVHSASVISAGVY